MLRGVSGILMHCKCYALKLESHQHVRIVFSNKTEYQVYTCFLFPVPRSPSRNPFFYDAPVILNDITCNGTEASFASCIQDGYGSFTDCSRIAVAQCEGEPNMMSYVLL